MNKIIFLDVDGPMKPARCYLNKHRGWDPVAVDIINHLCDRVEAKIVFNSTHNIIGNVLDTAVFYGIKPRLILGKTDYPQDHSRISSISRYLKDHPADMWCAIDDAPINHSNAVRIDPENGITMQDYRRACEIFGMPDDAVVLI